MKCIIVFTIIFLLFHGCCGKVDCTSINGFGIRILNKQDSTSLIFCNNKQYDIKNVLAYSKVGNSIDTITLFTSSDYHYISKGNPQNSNCDSLINLFPPYWESTKFYITYSTNNIDSFEFEYRNLKSNCCGNQTEVYNLKRNNKLLEMDSVGIYTIYK